MILCLAVVPWCTFQLQAIKMKLKMKSKSLKVMRRNIGIPKEGDLGMGSCDERVS